MQGQRDDKTSGSAAGLRTVAALKLAKGQELENASRGLVRTLPEANRNLFQLDAGKVAGPNLHSMSAHRILPPGAQLVLGPNPFTYAFRNDAVLVAAGANGIRQSLEEGSHTAPLAMLELNVNNSWKWYRMSFERKRQRARLSRLLPLGAFG